MKTVTAKELRLRTSAILEEARKGNEVMITFRGKQTAILKPVNKEVHNFKPIGFGLWKDRKDMEDVTLWVDERRNERKRPSGTL